jgi:hypothetical protein
MEAHERFQDSPSIPNLESRFKRAEVRHVGGNLLFNMADKLFTYMRSCGQFEILGTHLTVVKNPGF